MAVRSRKKAVLSPKQKNIALFLAKFFAVYLFFQFLILAIDLSFLENNLAKLEGNWLGLPAQENRIQLGETTFEINANCTGLVSGIILAGVVFGLKKPDWKRKAALWLAGALALFLLNIGRLYLVLWIGKNVGVDWANIMHEVSWFSTAVFILLIWILLSKRIARVKSVSELVE